MVSVDVKHRVYLLIMERYVSYKGDGRTGAMMMMVMMMLMMKKSYIPYYADRHQKQYNNTNGNL